MGTIKNEIILNEERISNNDEICSRLLVGEITEYNKEMDTVEIMIKNKYYITFRFNDLENIVDQIKS